MEHVDPVVERRQDDLERPVAVEVADRRCRGDADPVAVACPGAGAGCRRAACRRRRGRSGGRIRERGRTSRRRAPACRRGSGRRRRPRTRTSSAHRARSRSATGACRSGRSRRRSRRAPPRRSRGARRPRCSRRWARGSRSAGYQSPSGRNAGFDDSGSLTKPAWRIAERTPPFWAPSRTMNA